MNRQLHLSLFIHSRGHHEASWRHRGSSSLPLTDIRYYQDLARKETTAAGNPIDLRQRHRFPYLRASWHGQFAGVCTYIPGGTGWTPAAVPILIYPVLFSTSVRLAAPTPNPF